MASLIFSVVNSRLFSGDLIAVRSMRIVTAGVYGHTEETFFDAVKGAKIDVFGVGTKLSSEVRSVAGVIFKQCLINGRPTLKASNTPEKSTLPGRLGEAGPVVSELL